MAQRQRIEVATALLLGYALLTGCALLAACGVKPTRALPAYLGDAPPASHPALPTTPLRTGLVLLNETRASDSAPRLSADAVSAFAEILQRQVSEQLPLTIATVITGEELQLGQAMPQLRAIAQREGVDAILLVILSAVDVNSPAEVTMGAGSVGLPGTRLEDFALVEMALLDAHSSQVLAQSDGRDRASVVSANEQLRSTEFPVIRRGGRPISLRPQGNPYDLMRLIAASEASRAAVDRLRENWKP
jgi:hypothetical protein